jgi:hypothetical protein
MRRLGQEFRKLRGATALPLNAAAAIFVRQDEERPDKVCAPRTFCAFDCCCGGWLL